MLKKILFLFVCLCFTIIINAQGRLSPDEKQCFVFFDNDFLLIDLVTERAIKIFSGHTEEVRCVIFSPDGRQLVSGSDDGTVKLWDISSGQEIRTFRGHTDYVISVAFNHDGKQIASGSADGTVKLWDVTTGRISRTFSEHTDGVTAVAFSPDGRQLVSGSEDETVKLWDITTGRIIGMLAVDSVYTTAFSPDGRRIVSGSEDGDIYLWDFFANRFNKIHSDKNCSIRVVSFISNGNKIFSVCDHAFIFFDTKTMQKIRTIEFEDIFSE